MLEIALVVSESTTLAAALVAAFVAAVVAASVKDDRSTLLARLLSPLITLEDVAEVTRFSDPRISPEAKSL
jgi:hypothetical protein